MNPEQSRQQNNGWTKSQSGNFTALMKPRAGQVDPDAPGAKNLVSVLRYSFYVKDHPNGDDAVKIVPEKAMQVPYHRAADMIYNREARFLTDEEASPLFKKQSVEDSERAKLARIEADALIAQRKIELGEIPDVLDNDSSAKKIIELSATVAAQAEQMKQLMEMQAAFMQKFGQQAPGTTTLDNV